MNPPRKLVPYLIASIGLTYAGLSNAQSTAELQAQLQQIQESLQQMKQSYEQKINNMENKIQALQKQNKQLSVETKTAATEAAKAPAAWAASPAGKQAISAAAALPAAGMVAAAGTPPAAKDQGHDHEHKVWGDVDLGAMVVLDMKYSAQSQNPEANQPAGALPTNDTGIPRGFSVGETELAFFGKVDNLFKALARVVVAQEGNEYKIELEEGYAETLGLPYNTALRGGKYLSHVGYLNKYHPHDWDFADNPLVYRQYFGGALANTGLQFRWDKPWNESFTSKVGLELAQGSSAYYGYGGNVNSNKPGLGTVYLKGLAALNTENSVEGGVSWVRSTTGGNSANGQGANYDLSNGNTLNFGGGTNLFILDGLYTWAKKDDPLERSLKVQGEMFFNSQSGGMTANPNSSDPVSGNQFTDNQQGFYAQSVYQFMPKWRFGYRYDRLFNGTPSYGFGTNAAAVFAGSQLATPWDPMRNSIMMDWSHSENSRVRLQLSKDNYFGPGLTNNAITLQWLATFGNHDDDF